MKLLMATLMLLTIPVSSFAADYTGPQLVEAKAILASPKIASMLASEQKTHKLTCQAETVQDVQISVGADPVTGMDTFEVDYGCSAGSNTIQRIDFSGLVSTTTSLQGATTATVILTNMQLEVSE